MKLVKHSFILTISIERVNRFEVNSHVICLAASKDFKSRFLSTTHKSDWSIRAQHAPIDVTARSISGTEYFCKSACLFRSKALILKQTQVDSYVRLSIFNHNKQIVVVYKSPTCTIDIIARCIKDLSVKYRTHKSLIRAKKNLLKLF